MPETKSIALQDVVAAAAEGAMRALDARKLGAKELLRSGFIVDIYIRAGGRQFLNPQPLPPGHTEE
jgi:hypothetical protein